MSGTGHKHLIHDHFPETVRVDTYHQWLQKQGDFAPPFYAMYGAIKAGTSDYTAITSGLCVDQNNGYWLCTLPRTLTSTLDAGIHQYSLSVVGQDNTHNHIIEIERGEFEVLPAFSNATVIDTRTHARKMLEALEALLEGKASYDQTSYTIGTGAGSVTIGRLTPDELLKWMDYYKREVRNEEKAENLRNGRAIKQNIRIRFTGH